MQGVRVLDSPWCVSVRFAKKRGLFRSLHSPHELLTHVLSHMLLLLVVFMLILLSLFNCYRSGSAWHTLRSAWQPAFSPTALSSYLPAIHSAADALLYRLRGPAHSGEEVELAGLLTQLTMDVVGQAAYG